MNVEAIYTRSTGVVIGAVLAFTRHAAPCAR
jgi:hypothetical protein